MAFGIKRKELLFWKEKVMRGEIAFLTHYWLDSRFPDSYTVTKVGCIDQNKLERWGRKYGLKQEWIHQNEYPHYDLFGTKQKEILLNEGLFDHIERFNL